MSEQTSAYATSLIAEIVCRTIEKERLTKREQFALAAMQGMLTSWNFGRADSKQSYYDNIVTNSCELADKMLLKLTETENKD